ncbi:AAA family ATPase [Aliarcobacter cryaerophilus]|uniref:AAA family ATPase n=1 Tax=Arcobacter sp. AZ-2023 TaxID=3074453 RepID=A0AA96DMD9_9BACT|nr:AAA family ATPase [Arcobacter sp. AZ-2023]
MELVYLWVEDYKNIKRQGFTFSPRFRCEFKAEYDENGKLKDNCKLIINENKDYINIFPENINITAIVGQNGSGKTTLLELIVQVCSGKHHLVGNIFVIYADTTAKKTVYCKQEHGISIKNHFQSFDLNDLAISWINYNFVLNNAITVIVKKQSIFNMYGSNNTFKHIHVVNKFKNILNKISDKYFFDTFQIVIKEKNSSFIKDKILGIDEFYFSQDIQNRIKELLEKFNSNKSTGIKRITSNYITKEKIIEYNALLFFIHFLQLSKDDIWFEDSDEIVKNLLEEINEHNNIFEFLDNFEQYLFKLENDGFYFLFSEQYSNIKYLIKKINYLIEDHNKKEYVLNFPLNDIDEIKIAIDNTQFISGLSSEEAFYSNFMEYNFVNSQNNISFEDLSDGEKKILLICIDFLHHLDLDSDKNKIFICDEIDNSLHPIWKKELLLILLNLLKAFKTKYEHDKKSNIIFTSHSPFILSDIPKDNIVFLKKGVQVEAIEKKQTFGANIHTLLSDSFFMDGGLMGEFAKSKINDIIKILNKKKLSKKDIKTCEDIISIIGEPVLQNTLKQQFNQKIYSNETELQRLEREQKEIQNKIDKLKENTNETN